MHRTDLQRTIELLPVWQLARRTTRLNLTLTIYRIHLQSLKGARHLWLGGVITVFGQRVQNLDSKN